MTFDVNAIDLDKHAVIEASAGTGKTYTIEQLVLRLVCERKIPLDKILLVTFTEKATGELKDRLRKTLEKKLTAEASLRSHLQTMLDDFDQAPIFTIHGFCQRLLAEYAVEQGQDLRRELVEDYDLVEAALREVQRRVWTHDFGARLGEVLQLAAYTIDNAPAWDEQVMKLAARYRPEFGHVLMPATEADDVDVNARDEECRALVNELRTLAGAIGDELEKHTWYESVQKVPCHGGTRNKKLGKYVVPCLQWLKDAANEDRPFEAFLKFRDCIKDAYGDEFPTYGFRSIYEKPEQFEADLAENCPDLARAISRLQDFYLTDCRYGFGKQLAVKTIQDTRQHLHAIKADRGLCSFDDMIIDVAKALEPSNRHVEHFLGMLRGRFTYGIVDEFQDTDPLQWRIFSRIFLDGGQSKLVVVGDPKQAIYGFRGADLPTYIDAAQTMKGTHAAASCPLTTNWRSIKGLLEPLNCLFEHSGWFGAESEVRFEPVAPAPEDPSRTTIKADSSARGPFTIVDLREHESLKKAHLGYARFIADEIGLLLGAGIQLAKEGKTRPLNAGDVCVLVFTRSKAKALIEALKRADIPFTFYKQPGLWTSLEAEHLGVILKALADPDDRSAFRKALLTIFFERKPAEIAACGDIPAGHRTQALFADWLGFAANRQWSALFQSLLEKTRVLFGAGQETDRRIANLRHLVGALEEAAYQSNLDIVDLVEHYERLRRRGDEPQADVEPIDTQLPKVKIMTIHAAKGLEYPVVFLAGGFTKSTKILKNDFHLPGKHVFHLEPDPDAKTRILVEEAADNRRLLYVALTRAMIKLYVPWVSSAEAGKNYAGPVATILKLALETAMAQNPAFYGIVKPGSENRHDLPPMPKPKSAEKKRAELPKDLFPALDPNLSKRRLTVRSFSSLHRAARQAHFGEETARAEDEGPARPDDPLRGPVFGEIVHLVLEAVDFAAVGAAKDASALIEENSPLRPVFEAPVEKLVPRMGSRQPLAQMRRACLARVAELVWNALRRPLPGLGGCLCEVPRSDRVHELEFLFPQHGVQAPPAEVRLEEGFFTGFMDLVFRKNDLYYLLDWKTNDLNGYDAPAIARAMADGDYHRQYRLYLHALERWLTRRHGVRFNFLQQFGGVYYLFLRGMTGVDPAAGVFFLRPAADDLRLDMALGESP